MVENQTFYVIQFGARKMKYLGGLHRYTKVDSIQSAEKFHSKEIAERHLNIFENGRVVKVVATYVVE